MQRVDLETGSTACLLFDSHPEDLQDTVDLILQIQDQILGNPLALLTLFAHQCGFSSTVKQNARDGIVLGAEVHTKTIEWDDPGKMNMIKWPHDFFHVTTVLHICHNELLFLHYAIGFELQIWKFL